MARHQKVVVSGLVLLALAFFMVFEIGFQRAWGYEIIDTTIGFDQVPLNISSDFEIQRPYDVPQSARYSFVDGVHELWVYSTDKPHTPTSNTKPRTEIRILGHNYSSGVWQFEGYGYVPKGTSGVCIMQIFGASGDHHATTLMLRVYNGTLKYYNTDLVLDPNIYDKWFQLNVIHDLEAKKVMVFIDGVHKLYVNDRGGNAHHFKFGVYAQNNDSYYMESRWKGIKIFKKC
ncbi:hypothetical protein Sjap_018575 [Stephania japonica]|uniref:Alginate lyase 2 domain-containing protein n=1 Tax=Stephania japonica TaxID=461633 RepID=A0AAP0NLP2_9MAGN